MRVRLIVEGEKDRVVLDTIAQRVGAEVCADAVVAEGRGEKLTDLVGLVEAAHFSAYPNPERIVVVDDCDAESPERHMARLKDAATRCRRPIEICVIARELEAWFLADWETTSGAARKPAGWPSRRHPEEIVDAKEQLRRCLDGRWDQVRAVQLARCLDLRRVASRCNQWRGLDRFIEAVGGRLE